MEPRQNFQNKSPNYSDEINLFHLCSDLWHKRALILIFMVAALVCGASYAYFSPTVYKADVHIYPSISDDGPVGAFDLLNQFLKPESVAAEILKNPELDDIIESAFSGVTRSSKIKFLSGQMTVRFLNAKRSVKHTIVSFKWNDADQAAQLVDAWIGVSVSKADGILKERELLDRNKTIRNIDYLIDVKRKFAIMQIDNEIIQLKNAKIIADNLGISGVFNRGAVGVLPDITEYANVRDLRSLYLVGSNALDLEIKALELRNESGGLYVPGVTELQLERLLLLDKNVGQEPRIAARVNISNSPVVKKHGPKHIVVIVASLFLGLVLGVMVVGARGIILARKN